MTRSRRCHLVGSLGFALLVLLASGQRRLAELDFATDDEWLLENNDAVDGDEVFTKLTLHDNAQWPVAIMVGAPIEARVVWISPRALGLLVVDRSDPRAPPSTAARTS